MQRRHASAGRDDPPPERYDFYSRRYHCGLLASRTSLINIFEREAWHSGIALECSVILAMHGCWEPKLDIEGYLWWNRLAPGGGVGKRVSCKMHK